MFTPDDFGKESVVYLRKENRTSFLRLLVLIVLIAAAGLGSLAAQTTGTILGTLKDQSGAVLPGAEITVTNIDTGITRTATSGARGEFRISALAVGTYDIQAGMTGFQSGVRKGITLTIGREAVVDFSLQVGNVTEQVTVTGEAPLIETTSAVVGGVVDSKQMRDIPLNARSFIELAVTATTNTVFAEAGDSSATKGFGRKLAISGQRYSSNSFLLDGADINDAAGTSGSAAQTVAGVETVREFRVVTNAYDAEYGRHTGGVISAVTKSGENELHGSVFEFMRNDNLDAAKWEDNAFNDGLKAEFKRNQFGGSLGGPIIRDRTFFFGSYEGMREREGRTNTYTVPTLETRAGRILLSSATCTASGGTVLPGGICQLTISANTKPYLEAYPLPNGNALDADRADYTLGNPNVTNQDYYNGRIDHRFSDSDSIFGRITLDNSDRDVPQFNTSELAETASRYATIEQTHIYSPAVLGRTLFSFNRTSLTFFDIPRDEFPELLGKSLGSEADVPGIISVTNLSGFGGGSTNPKIHNQNTFQFKEDLSYFKGAHSLKFGAQFERFQFNQRSDFYPGGSFGFTSIADFLLNNAATANFIRPGSDDIRGWRENVMGLYLHDDWNVRPGLTLNLGVRYEFIKVPTEVNGKIGTVRDMRDEHFYSLTDQNTDTGDPYFRNPSLKNFAPRIGVVWSPFAAGKTSIRAGFGVFHDQIMPNAYITAGVRMAPYFSVAETFQENFTPLGLKIDFPNMFVTQNALLRQNIGSKPQADGFQYEVDQPAVYKWSFDIEQQIVGDLTVEAGYSAGRGTHLIRGAVMLNYTQSALLPNPNGPGQQRFILLNPDGALRNPNYNRMRWRITDATSDYQAFRLAVNKRFSRGFQLQSSYTFSKSTDDTSTWTGSSDFGDSDRRGYGLDKDHGLSAFDVRNSWSTNFTYELPGRTLTGPAGALLGGWITSGVLRFNNGFPLNPEAQQARSRIRINNVNTDFTMRFVEGSSIDLVPGGKQNAVSAQNPDAYIDISQYAYPATNCVRDRATPCDPALPVGAFLGNLGRNTLISPGVASLDFTLMKETKLPIISENSSLQLRWELFNLFNRPNFGSPSLTLFARSGAVQGGAGRIESTRSNARQMQFAVRMSF